MSDMQLIQIKNPFQRDQREITTLGYRQETIQDLYERLIPNDIDVVISINGMPIEKQLWPTTIPRLGDQIIVMPVVAGGGGGKDILGAIMMIAVVIAAPYAAVALGGAAAGTVGSLTLYGQILSAGLILGGGILVSSLMPAPQLKSPDDWDASQTYGWSPQTTQQQGLVVPRFYGKNKLFGNVIAVHTEVDGSDGTKQNIKMLVSLGSGPVNGIVADSIKINDQPASNFEDVTTEEKKGTLNQTAISFFGETKPEYRPNVVVSSSSARTYTTPDKDYDDLEIELLFDRGIYYANDQGGLSTHEIGIKIEISEAGADSWTTLVAETITNNITSPIRKPYTASESYTGGTPVTINNGTKYDIRVTKTTTDETSSRYGDQLRLGSVREVINDDFIYPRTALLGISALANDQLSGSLSVSCVQEGAVIRVYNGSTWSIEYNNNPAWVLWDILTQPVISGDGGGTAYAVERYSGIDPSRLDLDKFYELAQFCDELVPDGEGGTEKRITFNGGFDVGTTMWEAALKTCEIARCILVWNGIELTVAIDKAANPVQMFTIGNIHTDSFRETFLPQEERASEIEVQYRDELQDYERVPFTILDTEIDNPSNSISLELFGITKQSEAWRAGMFRLAQNKLLKSTVEFDVDIDAIACTIGDVIYVQHDVPEWGDGGRITSATVWDVIVDKDLEYASGSTYRLLVRRNDDTIEDKTVLSQYNAITGVNQGNKEISISGNYTSAYKGGDSIKIVDSTGNDGIYTLSTGATHNLGVTTITVEEAIPDATADGGLYNLRRVAVSVAFSQAPTANDVYAFGLQSLVSKEYRIIGLRKTSDQVITMTGIEYDEDVYDYDSDTPVIAAEQSSSSPDSDSGSLVVNPNWHDIERRYPQDVTIGPPVLDVPQITNVVFSNDTVNKKVTWTEGIITYKGATYAIASSSGDTKKYIYWDKENNPTTLRTTNNLATAVGQHKSVMCVNDNGVARPVGIGRPYWGEMLIVEALSALTAQLGDCVAGSLQGTTVTGGTIRTALSGRRVQIDEGGIKILMATGAAGTVGTTANGGSNTVVGTTANGGDNVIVGSGILARFYNTDNGIPIFVVSEQASVGDVHLYPRSSDPTTGKQGDIALVNNKLRVCINSTPTWQDL